METLGDYDIIKQLGTGSLGEVYLAEHRFMKRTYALKVLPEELSNDRGFIQRFQEEVKALSLLDHPGIVKIHNVSFASGHYFLVTDCVVDDLGETTNLAQFLAAQGEALTEEKIEQVLRQIASALDYSHSKKVVHGTLKLNNVLMKGRHEIQLTDLGLSHAIGVGQVLSRTFRAVAEAHGLQAILTGEGYLTAPIETQRLSPLHLSFIQNYAFLAPEQKRIHGAVTSDKSDVWAFGVLAHYMLTGSFPEGIGELPSGRWYHLLQACLQRDAARRPSLLSPLFDEEPAPMEEEVRAVPIETVVQHKAVVREESKVEQLQPVLAASQLQTPSFEENPMEVFQVDSSVTTYCPQKEEAGQIEPIPTDMVVVKGGEFLRGCNEGNRDEMPAHRVYLDSYAIDIHPVTNEQFVRFLQALGGEKDHNNNDTIILKESRIRKTRGSYTIESGYSKHPVVGVSWYGAVAYAKWVGKRLPTEAEWEVAARAGLEGADYPTGEAIEKSQANFFSSDSTAVMSYPPNGYGLYEMAGNAYEWCQDWYGYDYYYASQQEPDNPTGPMQGVYRVLRGGCWKSLHEDLRCSHRHRNNPGTTNRTYGFRCAADVK